MPDLPEGTLLVVTLIAMFVGLVGSVLPALPGVTLIFISALVYAYFTGFEAVGGWVIALLGLFAALALVADFIGTSYGARRFGASNWGTAGGAIGGILGALAGLLFLGIGSLFGLILGSVGGVFLGEYLKRRRQGTRDPGTEQPRVEPARTNQGDWRRTGRAAGGVFVGYLISAIAQGVLGLASVIIFLLAL
ncbi:DUF456 family protein [Rubrobacter tropicus]|uniref:DUF456 family protein n=1 Tax=Rubrobacter tropicus TaxID=2653851 RepID=A0A6G8Q838_9ACTN|nr:DUF456 domain-containing protein [Rubrobacter tropicus]QIN82613.1 DUF456 family protein [Rubrobacter tropicus]